MGGGGGTLGGVLEARRLEIDTGMECLRLQMEAADCWARLECLVPPGHDGAAQKPQTAPSRNEHEDMNSRDLRECRRDRCRTRCRSQQKSLSTWHAAWHGHGQRAQADECCYHDLPGNKFDKPAKSPFMDMMRVPVYADSARTATRPAAK